MEGVGGEPGGLHGLVAAGEGLVDVDGPGLEHEARRGAELLHERGVADGDVPRYGDEVMEHVITLDLARLPGLGRAGKRSLSLYLPDPGHGEKHERGVLVWRTEAELAAAPGTDPAT